MQLDMHVIDAFTDTPFHGNPAAVIYCKQWLPDDLMQAVATENNLSETAFCVANTRGGYDIRWFSPITEIAFCGHATLASAYVRFAADPALKELTFHAEAVGDLPVTRRDDGYIQMRFPNRMPEAVTEIPKALLEGLSSKPDEVWRNEQAYFAVYYNEEAVLNARPHLEPLKTLAPYDVVVTAPGKRFDFVSRYFWPANGGIEDPVTGSIHAGLAPFWGPRLDKDQMHAYQASSRGGELLCELDAGGVMVCGKAAPYLRGQITV